MQQVSELLWASRGVAGMGVFHYFDFLFRILHCACNLQICSTLATSFPKLAPGNNLGRSGRQVAAQWAKLTCVTALSLVVYHVL